MGSQCSCFARGLQAILANVRVRRPGRVNCLRCVSRRGADFCSVVAFSWLTVARHGGRGALSEVVEWF